METSERKYSAWYAYPMYWFLRGKKPKLPTGIGWAWDTDMTNYYLMEQHKFLQEDSFKCCKLRELTNAQVPSS